MDAPLTLDEVRDAVGDLTAALVDHQSLTDEQWDKAVSTPHIAREQHGGRIRQLIQHILSADGPDPTEADRALPDALRALHRHLAIADGATHRPRLARRGRRPAPPTAPHTQLQLELSDGLDHPPDTGRGHRSSDDHG